MTFNYTFKGINGRKITSIDEAKDTIKRLQKLIGGIDAAIELHETDPAKDEERGKFQAIADKLNEMVENGETIYFEWNRQANAINKYSVFRFCATKDGEGLSYDDPNCQAILSMRRRANTKDRRHFVFLCRKYQIRRKQTGNLFLSL